MIKSVFLASLAAVALCAPDADPAVLYGSTQILTAPTPLIHNPPVRPVVAAPLGYGYGIGAHFAYGKRDADADPAVLAGYSQILTAPTPLIHNPPVRPVVAAPLSYGYGIGAPLGYGLHHAIVKRDADADPQFLAGPYGALGYTVGAPLALASAGAVPHVPVVKNVEVTPAEVKQEVTAHTIPVAVGYHGLPFHYGKRDADADPQFLPALPYAGPVAVATPYTLASAGAIPHVPVVKSVEESSPAEVKHEVTAHAIPVAVGLGHYAHHLAAPFYG